MGNLLKIANQRKSNDYDPIPFEDGILVKFEFNSDSGKKEIRGIAKNEDEKEMGRISFVPKSGHFFLSVNMESLGEEKALALGDLLWRAFWEGVTE